MAAISTAPAAAALTPPSSNNGEEEALWEFSAADFEAVHEKTGAVTRVHQDRRHPPPEQNGISLSSSFQPGADHGFDFGAGVMTSSDKSKETPRWEPAASDRVLSPPLSIQGKAGRAAAGRQGRGQPDVADDSNEEMDQSPPPKAGGEDDSKWIHRDKLARIENAELQAAGLFVPRSRASSKQRRERSQNRLGRGTSSADMGNARPWKDSSSIEQSASEPNSPHWDLRSPQEIAQAEAAAYFASNGVRGGSRIPLAKTSPVPIPVDCLERGSPAVRRMGETGEGDGIPHPKARSRSGSLSVADQGGGLGIRGPGKKAATETSPKKNATSTTRKSSTASKTGPVVGRPKTRNGSNRDSNGARPVTKAGEHSSATRHPEGDPPWMINAYKPDPRLPPDQQLLPTVARRLQQERWEKEGKFGDTYDKEFRPLNHHEFPRSPEPGARPNGEGEAEPESDGENSAEWPLKSGLASTKARQGSYSTMPRISDTPNPWAPGSPPPASAQPLQAQGQDDVLRVTESQAAAGKRGCGCCVVM
ncbi:hypothetical protein DCS_04092 [Drechmeria coniospora]|uniref:TeaA receptor TeaR n=1 Tax=Drechmeria coniospora TaxID=98403 RepID=A0A151GIZ5_DRECN|nr:hypothetical protein DCS_04092 [Drechmeria coniospora]KYK57085.1 hypothetical protein DCS_04092 [Drechmeria coniospora]ODA78987.1 hypothetical protein RJ55_04577 [Drechmeria coniospora]